MAAFTDTDQLYTVMEALWSQVKEDKKMTDKLLSSKLIVRFVYREPDGFITIDGSDGKELKVYAGDCDVQPTIEMSMSSDVAHNFWLGKVNPAMALLQGKISSRGPVNKALALLPVIKPAFQIYPKVFERVRKEAA